METVDGTTVIHNQVLAACFRVDGAITRFVKDIDARDIGYVYGIQGVHELYKALVSYHKQTQLDIVDQIAFHDWLRGETDIHEASGGESGIRDLYAQLDEVELPATDAIVKMVEYRARKRRRLDKVQSLQAVISRSSPGDEEKVAELTKEIAELYDELDYDPLASVRTAFSIIRDMDDLWAIPPFLPTQYPALNKAMGYDEETGGFLRGGVHSIGAESGKGKSTLAKCLCNWWLDHGWTILFVNFEEAQGHWERILMTQVIERNVYAEANKIDSVEMSKLSEKFKKKLKQWGDRLMVRHDPDTLFFEDLEKWLRDILGHGARKPDVVVIDTIQSMFTKTGGRARWGDFEQIMVRLEKLAKDMDAVFIVTAQQNNNSLKDGREELNQADMGGSVTIVQKSTIALFLTSPKDSGNEDDAHSDEMEVQIVKNRITGTVFKQNPPRIRYNDVIKSYLNLDTTIDERYNNDTVDIEGEVY